jgi:hypothetical protein
MNKNVILNLIVYPHFLYRDSCMLSPFGVTDGVLIQTVSSGASGNRNGCKEHCYEATECTWSVQKHVILVYCMGMGVVFTWGDEVDTWSQDVCINIIT